jgi:hypothetical protein
VALVDPERIFSMSMTRFVKQANGDVIGVWAHASLRVLELLNSLIDHTLFDQHII